MAILALQSASSIPYEETEPKQLMVENIAITNNDKGEQNITKSKITESVEVPPHSLIYILPSFLLCHLILIQCSDSVHGNFLSQ
jgi:hypothetical protein